MTKNKSSKSSAEKTIRNIRRNSRRKYSGEEKIRIVLEGLRGEESIAELCRREGISQSVYYLNGQLIDVDEDFSALYERIDAKYLDRFVWRAKVEDAPMPTLGFRSSRLEAAE